MNILAKFLDFLFPTQCIVCTAPGPDICKTCLASFAPPKSSNYDWITSFSDYRDPNMEILMRHIKNIPNRRAVRILAKRLARMIPVTPTSNRIVLPVPIGYIRFIERGYNQSELIARPVAKLLGLPLRTNVLVKIKHTNKQGTAESKLMRAHNVKRSFGIKNPRLIQNKDIILVDDITTTGSTLVEARKVLLAAGARSVQAVTIAN